MLHSFDVIKEKVVRDGKVAVLVSPGFGAGWYSWHNVPELLFDPVVVELVESGRHYEIESYVEKKYPDSYTGGAMDLKVVWVTEGEQFRIDEYDGAESLKRAIDERWITA